MRRHQDPKINRGKMEKKQNVYFAESSDLDDLG